MARHGSGTHDTPSPPTTTTRPSPASSPQRPSFHRRRRPPHRRRRRRRGVTPRRRHPRRERRAAAAAAAAEVERARAIGSLDRTADGAPLLSFSTLLRCDATWACELCVGRREAEADAHLKRRDRGGGGSIYYFYKIFFGVPRGVGKHVTGRGKRRRGFGLSATRRAAETVDGSSRGLAMQRFAGRWTWSTTPT